MATTRRGHLRDGERLTVRLEQDEACTCRASANDGVSAGEWAWHDAQVAGLGAEPCDALVRERRVEEPYRQPDEALWRELEADFVQLSSIRRVTPIMSDLAEKPSICPVCLQPEKGRRAGMARPRTISIALEDVQQHGKLTVVTTKRAAASRHEPTKGRRKKRARLYVVSSHTAQAIKEHRWQDVCNAVIIVFAVIGLSTSGLAAVSLIFEWTR